jgi:hypothetical protein
MNEIVSWKIVEWSRESGRGRIASPKSDPIDFDASAASVDDFEPQEEVSVEFTREGDTWKVTSIRPMTPRFVAPNNVVTSAPELRESLATDISLVLKQVHLQDTYRIHSWTEAVLMLRGEETTVYPPPGDTIEFLEPLYAELAGRLSLEVLRLSNNTERSYLASKTDDFSTDSVAITLIDVGQRFFFVVCRALRYNAADRQ